MSMPDSEWRFCGSKEVIGVAICNYPGATLIPSHGLNISLGDRLRIVEENGQWYRGWTLDNQGDIGIFPAQVVHLKPVRIEYEQRSGETITFIQETAVAQEIVSALREWGQNARAMFLSEDERLSSLRKLAYDLAERRKQILSGALPVDEGRRIQREAVHELDEGNSLLGLDTIIRDDDGVAVNLDALTLPETFRLFKEAPARIISPPVRQNESQSYSMPCCFMVTIRKVEWKVGESAELIVSLYDEQKQTFITENCVLEWKRGSGFLHGEKVLFVDLKRFSDPSKIFLVCHVVRRGVMEWKENGTETKKPAAQIVRRPYGVSLVDVTEMIPQKGPLDDAEREVRLPITVCGDSDSLLATTRKAMAVRAPIADPRLLQSYIVLSAKLLVGSVKQVREEFPHLFVGNPPISRILGYPDVIVPSDVRNDIYITLDRAEFRYSGRNVEVSVSVCDDKGVVLPKTVCGGAGVELTDRHLSVVYYHMGAPVWNETLKVTVGFEQFATSHVRFLFKHRSSNETKDKAEKPFALAFLPLKSDDGTALQDRTYNMAVYRIDAKLFSEKSISPAYLQFNEFEDKIDLTTISNGQTKLAPPPSEGCYTYSAKESFSVSSLVCSTKLTQNVSLLGLLMWRSNEFALESNLKALPSQPGVQVVRYLRDILDVLFEILSDRKDSANVEAHVFEALVFLIDLATRGFPNFRPILDLYIKEDFCALLAYDKLISRLSSLINDVEMTNDSRIFFIKTVKSVEYVFKFIIQSRMLYAQMNQNQGEELFRDSMEHLLISLADFMGRDVRVFQTAQGSVLKYIPTIIPDLMRVLDPVVIASFFEQMIGNVPIGSMFQQQIDCILAVVQSPLFRLAECRQVLLPFFCEYLHDLEDSRRESSGASKVLMEMLVLLSDQTVGPSRFQDLTILIEKLLRKVVRSVIQLANKASEPVEDNFLIIMLSIFRQMTDIHYEQFIATFESDVDLVDFLQEIFISFKGSLFSKSVFPKEWSDMIMLQNTIMLQALTQFSRIIRIRFLEPFQQQLWNNFFQCAVEFCTQESLQLENFSENKQKRIRRRYDDMRLKMCFEVRAMWNSLGSHKRNFVPDLVASLLDMSLIPVEELRMAIIPIFFDMMQCEFRLTKSVHSTEPQQMTAGRRLQDEYWIIQGKFAAFETNMIKSLDVFIEGGRGDSDYAVLFEEIMKERCNNNSQMRELSLRFVDQLVKQMKLLLEYRDVMTSPDVDIESRMCCTVNLLEYYEGISKREMYIRYLYKLRDLHLHLGNFTEVAFTLEHHARLLIWTDDSLPTPLHCSDFPHDQTHRELKEHLFYEMIRYFDMGKSWEYVINRENGVFNELRTLYESDTYEYQKMSELLRSMAGFYDKVISPHETRVPCEYFRVAYYGGGFPVFWRNKAFVYRGKECDNIRDFTERVQNRFPGCVTLKTMDPPSKDILESDKMYLQIWKVEPVHQIDDRFGGKQVSHRIRNFYLCNDVHTFTYYRRLLSHGKDSDFANLWLERTTITTRSSLPGILRWSEVRESITGKVSPIQTAIETLQAKNDDIFRLVEKHLENPLAELDPQIGSILGGVLDPAVNGGISNYEKAFISPAYLDVHKTSEDRKEIDALKDLIANQIPLLQAALEIYDQKVKEPMRPFYNHIHDCYLKQKSHVEVHYGIRPPVFPKLAPKRSVAANRSYSNVEIRKAGSFVSYDNRVESGISSVSDSSATLSSTPRTGVTSKKSHSRVGGSLSASTLSLARSSRDSSSTLTLSLAPATPIELSQTLQYQRQPRRDAEKRHSRPGSGLLQPRRSSFAEEEPGAAAPSPPPLPVKRAPAEHFATPSTTTQNGGLLQNGFLTTPRRRLRTYDGGSGMNEDETPPEKPPLLPAKLPSPTPELPPKASAATTTKVIPATLEFDRASLGSPTTPRNSSRSSRSTSSTPPPPVPEKPAHLLRDGNASPLRDGIASPLLLKGAAPRDSGIDDAPT
ncbi:Dedicator of cytokinesis protein 1 [Hypsibius exemplaris]|uniref:Dedicator of cytokinesis protein 1 n=1 Tax=Hypsibius exemplaris TaxID=2072580 RepID=A0A1W0WS93_HYPEX|nr:Dedicator of cytokinesis protein 1 [Hypsibius exemplaris]